jgi:hypothetical protein
MIIKKYTMKKLKTKSVLTFVTLLFFGMMVQGQQVSRPTRGHKGSWRILGTTQANHRNDHDAIIVKGPYDYFRKLKFKVTDAPLQMHRMVVRYDDGGLPEKIDLRYNIPQGGESRIIDLKGRRRKIKSVELWYDTKGILRGKAKITMFGIK